MNGRPTIFVSVAAALLGLAVGARAQPVLDPPPAPSPAPATVAAMSAAEASSPYPTFAAIPAFPKDVRPLSAWKTAVMAIKASGADIEAQAAATPWTLANTEAWAADERAIATPPPPIPGGGDTEAFVAAMRARATPPPPLRHTAGATPATHP
jgi:hypothetical protein